MKKREEDKSVINKIGASKKTPKVLVALCIVAGIIVLVGVSLFVKITHDQKMRQELANATAEQGEPIPSDYLEAAKNNVENAINTDVTVNVYEEETLPEDGAVEISFTDAFSSGVIDYIGSSDVYSHVIGTGKTYVHYNVVMTFNDFYPLNISSVMFSDGNELRSADVMVKVNDGKWVNVNDLTLSDFGNYNTETDANKDCVFNEGDNIEIIAYVDSFESGNFIITWASPAGTHYFTTKSYGFAETEATETEATVESSESSDESETTEVTTED